jgi:hypothetical protein
MRTVTYKSVMDRIAGYMGEADGLSAEDQTLAGLKTNFFVRLAWQYYWWPELGAIERRTFRPAWDAGTDYPAPTATAAVEVFLPTVGVGPFVSDNGDYYQALQASTGEAPATLTGGAYVENSAFWAKCQSSYSADVWSERTYAVGDQATNPDNGRAYQCIEAHTGSGAMDLTKFGILTTFVRSLDYEQTDETPLGDVRFIWDRNPETDPRTAERIPFRLRSAHMQVLGLANVVWVEFRLRPSVFAGAFRTDAATYAATDTRYDTATGDYWTANAAVAAGQSPTTHPTLWDRVEFPEFMAEYVAQSVYAMLTDREQETPENFAVEDGAGWPLLAAELDRIERQQGQVRQLNVVSGRHRMGGWFY